MSALWWWPQAAGREILGVEGANGAVAKAEYKAEFDDVADLGEKEAGCLY
jgi:hypothetical protein